MRGAWWVVAVVGCTGPEYGVNRQTRVDVFEQDRLAAIDLLLVVDNSKSMDDEQENLAETFDTLITALDAGNTDWRVGVTTPETSFEPWRSSLEGAMDEVIVEGANGTTLDAVAWDDRTWAVDVDVAFSRCDAEVWQVEPASRGARNPCAGGPAAGVDDGPRAPRSGEVLVNEFVPRTSEPGCGWVELWNPTAATLDLSGVLLRDDGRDVVVVPDGTTLAPDATVVWTSFEDCGAADLVDPGLHLATGARWVGPSTEDGAREFSELVAVGDDSFGLEMGFENALATLAAPAHPEKDGDFLRDDADLAVVFFSDEDDLSPDSVNDYINGFRSLKGTAGQREAGRVRLAVVAGITPPTDGTDTSCSSALGEAVFAPRYAALAERSDGNSWSICGDLGGIAESVGLTVSEQRHEFQLSGIPALDTLDVGVFSSVESEERLSTPVEGVDWVMYVQEDEDGSQEVWMKFADGVLPPGSVLIVSYESLPDTATLDLPTTAETP